MEDHSSSTRPLAELTVLERPRKPNRVGGGIADNDVSELAETEDSCRTRDGPRKEFCCDPARDIGTGAPLKEFFLGDSARCGLEDDSRINGERVYDFVGELPDEGRD